LDFEQIEALKKGFEGFDKENSGIISGTAMQMIFKMMGVNVQKNQLDEAILEVGGDANEGKFDFYQFCGVASKFLIEEDVEQMREELKEAFRIYDKEGMGYITTDVLKEILREIDNELTEDDLNNIVEEVDEDGSGTLDFDGKFMTKAKGHLHISKKPCIEDFKMCDCIITNLKNV
jgi:calmodulin